jgi:hypothetical protein
MNRRLADLIDFKKWEIILGIMNRLTNGKWTINKTTLCNSY